MLPGPDRVLACPRCAALVRHSSWASTNTFGSTLWSDGHRAGPMTGAQSPWVCCPSCAGCFWLVEATKVGQFSPYGQREEQSVDPAWANAPHVIEPTELQLIAGAEEQTDTGRCKRLRALAWHAGNDPHRVAGAPHGQRTWQPHFIANLEALVALFDDADPDEAIVKVEALRELGRFDEALFQLRRVQGDAPAYVVEEFARLCRAQVRDVVALSEAE